MLSQSTPMYETPGIGFGGLGSAHLNINQPARGGMDSASNPYWDGDWNTFSWNNGFTGDQDTYSSVNGEKCPSNLWLLSRILRKKNESNDGPI